MPEFGNQPSLPIHAVPVVPAAPERPLVAPSTGPCGQLAADMREQRQAGEDSMPMEAPKPRDGATLGEIRPAGE